MTKYNAKKIEYDGYTFDSKVECDYYKYLQRMMPISEYNFIELQPKFELLPKFGKQRKTEYVADFALWNDGELLEVIDVKGMATETAKLKAKFFRYLYPNVKLTWICKAPKYTGKAWMTYEELIKVRRERKKAK